jgi:hypothetical protein
MLFDDLLGRFSGVRRNGDKATALCPYHPDKNASLSLKQADDGTTLVYCFAGCATEDVLASIGLKMSDLRNGTNGNGSNPQPKAPPIPEEARPLEITEGEVDLMVAALQENSAAQEYLNSRGISTDVASRLRFGYASKYFVESGELPAISMPDFRDGKLIGVKYRSIEGRAFSYARGSSQAGLFNRDGLDPYATAAYVFEGPLDAALAMTFGFNAVALNSATAKLTPADYTALKRYRRAYLVGDMDAAGQKAMDALAQALPPELVSRVRLPGVKDIGELFAQSAVKFEERFKEAIRIADIRRPRFEWDDLETESEVKAGGTGVLPYLVDGLIPDNDLTMFAGREGSCKTILALYTGKCVANGRSLFGNLRTAKRPVIYLDAENHPGTHQVYLRFFEEIGPEEIRFRTLRHGVPSLNDPALLKIVEEKRPLLIVDSLIRFCGSRDRDNAEMTEIMEQLARLVTAGATVLLIHHTRRSDEEEYANSFAIGATVAFWYAIVSEDTGLGVKRVKMIHKKARGGSEVNRMLIAFPAILDQGMFTFDGDLPKSDKELVIEFVRARGGCNYNAIKNDLRGIGATRKKAALDQALESGELFESKAGRERFFTVQEIGSGTGNRSIRFDDGSDSGTDQNRSDVSE